MPKTEPKYSKLRHIPMFAGNTILGDGAVVLIVDPNGVIQWVDVNQGRVGRNVAEVIRVLDALQSDELCPCNWKKGDPYVKVG